MSVRIRLKRIGTKKRPFYRIVVMNSRDARDGKTIEEIGQYRPIMKTGSQVVINKERVDYWVGLGATISDTTRQLINKVK